MLLGVRVVRESAALDNIEVLKREILLRKETRWYCLNTRARLLYSKKLDIN